ncbi:MAG: NAD-dependent epimerase/dehydratase family protein [Actinomycetales bacterium]|nr:NAD-dependent epimerase/dehydratase family protein [Actinomycetales bacterium]
MRALVTGAAGQDGTILASKLCREGHQVVGVLKPGTDPAELLRYAPCTELVECDLADAAQLESIVVEAQPDQVFNFGGISSIMESVENPELTVQVNVEAVRALLRGVRTLARRGRTPALIEAASGTIFEGADRSPQTESSPYAPQTPYARSKAEAIAILNAARDEGLFAASAILYNHESPLRGDRFVTRKISKAVARIARGMQDTLELGNIEVARDWGWAPDYVDAMRKMAGAARPHDYVLATGISHRLSFFIQRAFRAVGISDWRMHVVTASEHERPVDSNILVGDSRAAYLELGWRHTVDFDHIATKMVEYDLLLLDDPDALWQIP